MNSTLYELTMDYHRLLELGDSDEPDDQRCFLDTLDGLIGEIDTKADSYAAVISEFDAQAQKIDTEIVRLTNMKRTVEGSVKKMKERLMVAMKAMDRTEIRTDLHTFKIQANGGKRKLDIHSDVPDKYQKIVYEPDTDKIRAVLEAGEKLDFAVLQERGEHLRIK